MITRAVKAIDWQLNPSARLPGHRQRVIERPDERVHRSSRCPMLSRKSGSMVLLEFFRQSPKIVKHVDHPLFVKRLCSGPINVLAQAAAW
jgi:hypothetical protein